MPTATPTDLDAALRTMLQGLLLSRASTLSLMRLQLAVRSGERVQAMEAMDRLDMLDTELERVIANAPLPGYDDSSTQIIAKHIEDQKLALAFEKLALASGIVGPDMVSPEEPLLPEPDAPDQSAAPEAWQPPEHAPDIAELAALRTQEEEFTPHRSPGVSSTVIGLILTLLIAAGVAAAAWAYL